MKMPEYGIGFITVLFCLTATAADLDRTEVENRLAKACLLYTSPSPRD